MIGVPQGGVLSPVLFNIFINDLLTELQNKGIETLAFADDIVITAKGITTLSKAITIIEHWSKVNKIVINKTKSAIINIRVDKRTPKSRHDTIKGIPVRENYKYLGITIDDCLKFTPFLAQRRKQLKDIKAQAKRRTSAALPRNINFQAWTTFVQSKLSYGLSILSQFSPKVEQYHEQLIYT